MSDNVNQPKHYMTGGIENIDYIKAKLTPEEFRGFCKGNALKYLGRANEKGKHKEDVEKAEWYLMHLRTGGKTLLPEVKEVVCGDISWEECECTPDCKDCRAADKDD